MRATQLCTLLSYSSLLAVAVYGVTKEQVDEEQLIGWKGDSYKPQGGARNTWIEQISWKPRAAIFHNFISDAEVEYEVTNALSDWTAGSTYLQRTMMRQAIHPPTSLAH